MKPEGNIGAQNFFLVLQLLSTPSGCFRGRSRRRWASRMDKKKKKMYRSTTRRRRKEGGPQPRDRTVSRKQKDDGLFAAAEALGMWIRNFLETRLADHSKSALPSMSDVHTCIVLVFLNTRRLKRVMYEVWHTDPPAVSSLYQITHTHELRNRWNVWFESKSALRKWLYITKRYIQYGTRTRLGGFAHRPHLVMAKAPGLLKLQYYLF